MRKENQSFELTGQDVRKVADWHVKKVEDWPPGVFGPGSQHGAEGLKHARRKRDCAEDGVSVRDPAVGVNNDDDEAGECQQPSQAHHRLVSHEPQVFSANFRLHPRSLHEPGRENADWRQADPGCYHKAGVDVKHDSGALDGLHNSRDVQVQGQIGCTFVDIVKSDWVLKHKSASRQKQEMLVIDQIKNQSARHRHWVTLHHAINHSVFDSRLVETDDCLDL